MKKTTRIRSRLEQSINGGEYKIVRAGMYDDARRLAYLGRYVEAIEKAHEIRLINFGNIDGYEFKFRIVVTGETTIEI